MMTGRLLLSLLLSTALALPALAAAPRSEVIVTADNVTLGDIFDGVSDAISPRVVMASPVAGRSTVIDSRILSSLAARNGIAWKPQTGYEFARIERASQRFDATALTAGILRTLTLPAAHMGETSVQLDNPQLVLHAPLGAPAELSFSSLTLDSSGQRFSGLAVIKVGPQLIAQSQIAGRVVTNVEMPVLSRPIRRGELITANDISWRSIELGANSAGLLFAAEDLIGKSPRTAVRPGVPLRPADLLTPPAIARGTQVTMLYSNGGLQLTAQGRAMSDGVVGDVIRVTNLGSSRTVEGTIEAPGVVRLGPTPTPPAMASAPVAVSMN